MVKPSQKGSKAKFSPDPQATSSPPQRSQLGVSVKRLLEACGGGHLGARGQVSTSQKELLHESRSF